MTIKLRPPAVLLGRLDAVIRFESGAIAAENQAIAYDFSSVHYLLAAKVAIDAKAGAADDFGQRKGESNMLHKEQIGVGHGAVGIKLGVPAVGYAWSMEEGALAGGPVRGYAESVPGVSVNEGGGYFAVINQAEGAVAEPAAGRYREAISIAAIGLDEGEQALVRLG
jgi:hypothetical protein